MLLHDKFAEEQRTAGIRTSGQSIHVGFVQTLAPLPHGFSGHLLKSINNEVAPLVSNQYIRPL